MKVFLFTKQKESALRMFWSVLQPQHFESQWMCSANMIKTNAFWRSQHETFLRLTKNEPMVLVRIWKVFTRIGEIYSEKERALQIYIMTSKFKLCFVIDVVTIWYSLYWHRIVFDKNQSLWSQLFVMGNWYICCWNKKWSILFYFYYDNLFSDVLAYQENNFVVLALKDWKDELKPDSRVGRK